MDPVTLSDGRVVLGQPGTADLDDVVAQCRDPEFARWTMVPQPYAPADAREWVERLVPRGWAEETGTGWSVRVDGRHAGGLDLRLDGARGAEIGFGLAPWGRGQGVMTAAARLALDWAFDALDLAVVTWQAQVGNWASRRVAWRLGFQVEGTRRQSLVQRGQRRDGWVASLRREDPRQPRTRWLATPVLTGEGMVLRRWRDSDADAVVTACSDPVSRHWMGELPDPYTREAALGYLASREEEHARGRGLHLAVAADEQGAALGAFSIMGIDPSALDGEGGGGEVGYWLHPAARGAGMAARATATLVAHGFAPRAEGGLGLRRLRLAHAAGNEASRRTAQACGFRHWGVERQAERLGDGTLADLHWYDLLAGERGG